MYWELIEKSRQQLSLCYEGSAGHQLPPTAKIRSPMADDTDAGLPVRQLLKMVASGDLRAVLYVFGKPDFHIWSRLREFGAHTPDPDLESFKTRLRDSLTPRRGGSATLRQCQPTLGP